ncbi:MAG: general secretion pathway protein GspK [Verrucomicrobia bacterium]|nr:general secretion pathway protein GspK [Verrucomicrobiota bacterium]
MKLDLPINRSWSSSFSLSRSTLKRELHRVAEVHSYDCASPHHQRGSVLVIVLWIAFGLVAITLYFANSMSLELRASDNRVSGEVADQAIAGAARYVRYVLSNWGTNGLVPDVTLYAHAAVPVGDAHFWLIGRDTNNPVNAGDLFYGLVDEASKLNLNTVTSNMLITALEAMPQINLDLASAIIDWRDTNGTGPSQTYYAMLHPAYQCKSSPFETVDELRLVLGADMATLVGEDVNRNGVLDPNENDDNHNGLPDCGLLDYVTVYSREPATYSNGVPRIDIRVVTGTTGPLASLLQATFGAGRASQILTQLGLVSGGPPPPPGGGQGGGRPPQVPRATFTSPLQFYRMSRMKPEEFALVANAITVSAETNYIEGRINVNTARAAVLACLPGFTLDLAQQLVTYRQVNPDKLTSIAWVVDALGQNNATTLTALEAGDYITTQSYQFTADVAALGPYGRGYRRTRFVFDTSDGTPKIIYRQDLSHLGWALGKEVRQTWLAKATQ